MAQTGEAAVRYPYTRFLAHAVGVLGLLLAVGAWPTVRLGGRTAVAAMLVGCGLSLLASLAGTAPIVRIRDRAATETLPFVMGSIVLRMAVVIALAAAAALSGLWAPGPLLIWVAISHAGLLVVDTHFAHIRLRAGS